MSVIPTQGALADLGIQPRPVDTLAAVRRAGLDPSLVASCAPRSPGVRGCAMWKECPFHLKRYFGFKSRGPKNVVYYLRTDEGSEKEDYIACHSFTRVLLSRMRAGAALIEKGEPGELIRVIGIEGDEYVRRMWVKADPKDKREEAEYVEDLSICIAPNHPRIGDSPDLEFHTLMRQREAARRAADPDSVVVPLTFDVDAGGDDSDVETTADIGTGDVSGDDMPIAKPRVPRPTKTKEEV